MAYQGYSPIRTLGDVEILGADPYDILGDVEILGEDDVLGARRRRRGSSGRPSSGGGSASNTVRMKEPDAARRLHLPIDSGVAVVAGATSVITLAPVEAFRAEQIVIDPTVAPSFILAGALVGRKSQLLGAGSLPCTLFTPTNPFVVQWDTAQTSQPIVLTFVNTSLAALRLMGALLGTNIG
jgi:hypothetical protein